MPAGFLRLALRKVRRLSGKVVLTRLPTQASTGSMTQSLFILTGSGVSAESGLGTFRDTDGLWAKFDWRELATPEAFASKPEQVHAFYNARRAGLKDARPNAAHHALAELEKAWLAQGGDFLLVTQNVDDLHEQAGSERVVHMHGELKKMRCEACGYVHDAFDEITTDLPCLNCREAGGLRPHIVWFGEMPMEMELIYDQLEACDLFVAIGTSGTVYPAAGFSQVAKQNGARCLEINLADTDTSPLFDEVRKGVATQAVPAWVADMVG